MPLMPRQQDADFDYFVVGPMPDWASGLPQNPVHNGAPAKCDSCHLVVNERRLFRGRVLCLACLGQYYSGE